MRSGTRTAQAWCAAAREFMRHRTETTRSNMRRRTRMPLLGTQSQLRSWHFAAVQLRFCSWQCPAICSSQAAAHISWFREHPWIRYPVLFGEMANLARNSYLGKMRRLLWRECAQMLVWLGKVQEARNDPQSVSACNRSGFMLRSKRFSRSPPQGSGKPVAQQG